MKYRIDKNYCPVFLSMAAVLFNLLFSSISVAEDKNEETFSISLEQTAEVSKETVELGNKKILTETYKAKEGDHIWQILRKRDLLKKNNLGEVLSALKKLNPSLSNIDLIHPGEKIIIPLVITPITGKGPPENTADIETIPLKDMKNLEYYTVSKGDSLIKVINQKYSIPQDKLYDEYLDQLKKLNPDLKDLNIIHPGQKIRLPIYSPKIARGTIIKEKQKKPKRDEGTLRLKAKKIGDNLNRIFTLIGEEWVAQGKQFIPLKTGGQIDLNNEKYPTINLRNGDKVIVDLFSNLPEKMAELIKSNWKNYRIVHLTEGDNLKSAVAKILSVCNYDRVFTEDESLVFDKGIKIELTADWIIRLLPEPSNIEDNIICLNMTRSNSETVPSPLKNFLESNGVKIIDYPPEPANKKSNPVASKAVSLNDNRNVIVEKILELAGQQYSGRKDIPIYQGKGSDFNLIIKADYFFKRNGKDCIIDLSSMGSDIIALLKEHKFLVLSLSDKTKSGELVAKILDFLGLEFKNDTHTFYAFQKNRKENVKIIIPGILFKDVKGQSDFFSSVSLPADIATFLSMKVDNIFYLKPSTKAE